MISLKEITHTAQCSCCLAKVEFNYQQVIDKEELVCSICNSKVSLEQQAENSKKLEKSINELNKTFNKLFS